MLVSIKTAAAAALMCQWSKYACCYFLTAAEEEDDVAEVSPANFGAALMVAAATALLTAVALFDLDSLSATVRTNIASAGWSLLPSSQV